jgi:hypothetical protein
MAAREPYNYVKKIVDTAPSSTEFRFGLLSEVYDSSNVEADGILYTVFAKRVDRNLRGLVQMPGYLLSDKAPGGGYEPLLVHPCGYSSSTDSGCEAKARTSHRKVADEVPDQSDQLQY